MTQIARVKLKLFDRLAEAFYEITHLRNRCKRNSNTVSSQRNLHVVEF